MAKLTLSPITDNDHAVTMNANLDLIEAAIENTLSRDGTSPNQMNDEFDLNSNFIINMPPGTAATHPLQKQQIEALITAGVGGGAITLNSLVDVTVPAPSPGDVLTFVGPNWENAPSLAIPFPILTDTLLRSDGATYIEGSNRLRMDANGVLTFRDGTGNDTMAVSHPGTDALIAFTNTGDLNITGLTGRINQGAEVLAFVSELSSVSELSDLTDVNTSTPTNGFVLVADGVDFESRALLKADISDLGTIIDTGSGGVVNQVAVFADSDTIEGDPNFLWDGTRMSLLSNAGTIGGDFYSDGITADFRTDWTDIRRWILSGWDLNPDAGRIYLNTTGNADGFSIAAGGSGIINAGHVNYESVSGPARLEIGAQPGDGSSGTSVDVGRRTNTTSGTEFRVFRGDGSGVFEVTLGSSISANPGVNILWGLPLYIDGPLSTGDATHSHDDTDYNTAFTGTTDWNITGLSGRILQGAETLAFVSELGGAPGFPLLAPDGAAGAPSYSFSGESRSGFWRAVGGDLNLESFDGNLEFHALNRNIMTVDDTGLFGAFVAAAGTPYLVMDTVASGTTPVYTFAGENDTGIGKVATGELSLIASAVEIARAVNAATDQFIVHPATATIGSAANPALQLGSAAIGFNTAFSQLRMVINGTDTWRATGSDLGATATTTGPGLVNAGTVSLTAPGLAPIADNIGTGIGSSANNNLALIIDSGTAVLYSEATARIVQTNEIEGGLTASVTQTQAGGLLLRCSRNEVATVATTGDAVTAFACAAGTMLKVINNGANDLQLFPAVGDNIGAGVDTAITIVAGGVGIFLGRDATNWDTLYNALPTPTGGATQVANDCLQIRRTTDYTLTTAFVDVTLDTLDIETDAAVLEHAVATDNITLHEAGTYRVSYDADVICTAVTGDPIISMDARMRLNDTGVEIPGSDTNPYVFRDGSVGGANGQVQKHVHNSFTFTAAASDFITLQLGKTELSGSATFNVTKLHINVERML